MDSYAYQVSGIRYIAYSIPPQTHASHIHSYMNIQTNVYLLTMTDINKTLTSSEGGLDAPTLSLSPDTFGVAAVLRNLSPIDQ